MRRRLKILIAKYSRASSAYCDTMLLYLPATPRSPYKLLHTSSNRTSVRLKEFSINSVLSSIFM
jgi:hypothetical protein